MMPPPSHYEGRGPAQVKHHFLKNYLGRLVHKTASVFDEIVYVDGYAGPWQSKSDRYEDTSFGIALEELTKAKASWKMLNGRDVRMSALLVEKDIKAFDQLGNLQTLFPDVEISPHKGEFIRLAPGLVDTIPRTAFTFFFIDPKGWLIDIAALRPVIARKNSEVVFNFMFDFINRFATLPDAALAAGLDRLIRISGWRDRLQAIATDPSIKDKSKAREQALIEAFKETVSLIGGYNYVADVPVLRATRDRTLYFLVYGTRSSSGIEVFRDCQISALQEQSRVRGVAKVNAGVAATGQFELLQSLSEMGPDPVAPDRAIEKSAATATLIDVVGAGKTWGKIWPIMLSKHMIKRSEANEIANQLRKNGQLIFPAWPSSRKRKPEDDYMVLLP
jgi:three-Cys-motif partner protein